MPDFKLDDMDVVVIQKNIKNVHLSVYPPVGSVRISAPEDMSMDAIRAFVISKLNWIKRQRNKLQAQEREAVRGYLDRETHYFNGKSYLLKVEEVNTSPNVHLCHDQIILQVRSKTDKEKCQELLESWYRCQLRQKVNDLIPVWENKIGVTVSTVIIRKMKTKWGSCSPNKSTIRINTELAKKPAECLEYIVVHELVHLLEKSHNDRFKLLMDQYLPKWRFFRDELNQLPVRHEKWKY